MQLIRGMNVLFVCMIFLNRYCKPAYQKIGILLLGTIGLASHPIQAHETNDLPILHHIQDAHEWHFFTYNQQPYTLPLPIILYSPDRGIEVFSSSCLRDSYHQRIPYRGYQLNTHGQLIAIDKTRCIYDFSITKNVAAMLWRVLILVSICLAAARQYARTPAITPRGFWAFIELLICFIRDDIAIPNLGLQQYMRFLPYLLSLFFFIWLNNLMGLLPGAANVTGNTSVTLTLALGTCLLTNSHGTRQYWKHHLATPGVPKWLLPLMIPIEMIGLLTKPFSLMIRLFANITAGHIILLSIISLIFIMQNAAVGLLSVPFGSFMFLLKLLVAFLQAYIFTLLSAIYIGAAVANHDPAQHT